MPPLNFQNKTKGNALFIILLAVALFAALSYAVTRSGGGRVSISKEQTELKAARLIAYAGAIQAAVNRMVLSGAATPASIKFNTALLNGVPCSTGTDCVFAPEGGGVAFINWDAFFTAVYNSRIKFYPAGVGAAIEGIGTSAGEVLMAITSGPTFEDMGPVCDAINKKLNLPLRESLPHNQFFSSLSPPFIFDSLYLISSTGVPMGCFRDEGNGYGFYMVLMEQ